MVCQTVSVLHIVTDIVSPIKQEVKMSYIKAAMECQIVLRMYVNYCRCFADMAFLLLMPDCYVILLRTRDTKTKQSLSCSLLKQITNRPGLSPLLSTNRTTNST